MDEFKKRQATAKRNLTELISQVEIQEAIEPPNIRDFSVLNRQFELLNSTEETYQNNHSNVLDGSLDLEEEQLRELEADQLQFSRTASKVRQLINAMIEQKESYFMYNTLLQEVEDWEAFDIEDLDNFPSEYLRLKDTLTNFRASTNATGAVQIPEVKVNARDLLKRLNALLQKSKKGLKSSCLKDKDKEDDHYTIQKKARTVPLPTFSGNLADWRSFWRRFKDYIEKLRRLTDDERLSYLLDCLKVPDGQDIVSDAIRNGDSFDQVERRLNQKYDQPREVYAESLKALILLSATSNTQSGISHLGKEFNKHRNVLLRYGDATLDQAHTAIAELLMSAKCKEEWKLHTEKEISVPSAEKLLKFCDQRSLILTDKESKKDSKSIVQSSLPQQLKKTSKPQLSLHISSSSPPCKFCQYGNHRLILCPKFKSMDPVARHQAVQSVRSCFNSLGSDHSVKTCSRKGCRECGKRHHTLLHRLNQQQPNPNDSQSNSSDSNLAQDQKVTTMTTSIAGKTVIVRSCQVLVDVEGRIQVVRAMIDPGAAISFITGRIVSSLRAKRIPSLTHVTGLEETQTSTSCFKIEAIIRDPANPEASIDFSPAVVSSITGTTPTSDLCQSSDLCFARNL